MTRGNDSDGMAIHETGDPILTFTAGPTTPSETRGETMMRTVTDAIVDRAGGRGTLTVAMTRRCVLSVAPLAVVAVALSAHALPASASGSTVECLADVWASL